jgi:hypothetical protein
MRAIRVDDKEGAFQVKTQLGAAFHSFIYSITNNADWHGNQHSSANTETPFGTYSILNMLIAKRSIYERFLG